jgi:hypothetical protein
VGPSFSPIRLALSSDIAEPANKETCRITDEQRSDEQQSDDRALHVAADLIEAQDVTERCNENQRPDHSG